MLIWRWLSVAIACLLGVRAEADGSGQRPPPIVLRAVYPLMTTDHPYYVGLAAFKKQLETETAGRVVVEIIRNPNLPPDAATLEQLRAGGYHLGLLASSTLTSYTKDDLLEAWALPFLYQDSAAAYRAWDSEVARSSFARFEKYDVQCVALWDAGFRSLSANRPIGSPSDLKGLRVRVVASHLYLDTWTALGASPVVIGSAAELYTALVSGIVNATEMPVYFLVPSKLYEVQRYAILINYLDDPICTTISSEFLWQLTPELRAAVMRSIASASSVERADVQRRSAAAVDVLRSKGVVVAAPQLQSFRLAVQPIYDRYLSEHGIEGRQLLESIRQASRP
jgi:TRAP-type transport system periplasmic protein